MTLRRFVFAWRVLEDAFLKAKFRRDHQCLTTARLPLLRGHFRVPHGNAEAFIYKPLPSGKEQVGSSRQQSSQKNSPRSIIPSRSFQTRCSLLQFPLSRGRPRCARLCPGVRRSCHSTCQRTGSGELRSSSDSLAGCLYVCF